MIQRNLKAGLLKRIDYKKVLILFGPRQVGKTTLVKHVISELQEDSIYFNGDDVTTRNIWRLDQIALLRQSFENKKIIVLDEAQMIADIGLICKQLVDQNSGIQLILTGSSALNIANITQEPLTGRKWEYFLYPISFSELIRYEGLLTSIQKLPLYLIFGTYPEIITSQQDAKQLLTNLTNSYLYKDILTLTGVKKPMLLEKILKALAWQVGAEVSLNELSKIVAADVKTIDQYIYLLEQVFVVYRIGTYSRNLRNEINTKKKIFFYDNGIRNSLIGNYSPLEARQDIGALWENFLLSERKKLLAYNGFYGSIYFWRNKQQAEVDYIEEIDGKLYAFEFKWNPRTKVNFPKAFVENYKPERTEVIHRDNFWEWLQTYPY
ncbi:ATP-binding protein [Olivibacter domesticus]|uniref:AAA+ ATPase domain-containing protein n=1 Tax=Olivibacter domesticus TaxID=407022 RepID=A0A1H7SE52_OLID1|nr:ATP-binding protein [Olivibacter domesticus]SEL70902.1 hypothetical protein SAMN05661044_03193 [Olivibacter domesticus]